MNADSQVAVAYVAARLEPKARQLAEQLELPLTQLHKPEADLLLVITEARLELREISDQPVGAVYVDFLAGAASYRRKHGGGRGQLLAKAVGLKRGRAPSVLDATAGLGNDAFVLATLGCSVQLVERSKIIGTLLADGLERAKSNREIAEIIGRMHLTIGDAAEVMRQMAEKRPDAVYLDPMYPPSGKAALKGKEMRLFRKLVGDDLDAAHLLEIALSAARERVVVKRPKNAPALAGRKPNMALEGKTTRYDLYLT